MFDYAYSVAFNYYSRLVHVFNVKRHFVHACLGIISIIIINYTYETMSFCALNNLYYYRCCGCPVCVVCVINPRRACAARVTVVILLYS